MKRCFFCLLVLLLALFPSALAEEENTLVIAVLSETDAWNVVLEEAFFETCPNAEIEYRLYSEEMLNTMLMSGSTDFDLAILPYTNLRNMAEKGYLASIDETLGKSAYPEELLDYSELLTWNGQMFALPVSVGQTCWIWNQNIAAQADVHMPDASAWTWEAYEQLSEQFPYDVNEDGQPDIYLMYGGMLPQYPSFQNVNLGMFEQYVAQYSDFETFAAQYLDLFRKVLTSDALLSMNSESGQAVISVTALMNPIALLANQYPQTEDETGITFDYLDESAAYRFLPPPLLNAEHAAYAGTMTACGMMKTARHPELAAAFIRGMISPRATTYSMFGNDMQLVSKEMPQFCYLDTAGMTIPDFTSQDGLMVFRVRAERGIPTTKFLYSEKAFEEAQAFRAKLSISPVSMTRDFYNSAWSILQEWYCNRLSDEEMVQSMDFLFSMAFAQK